MKVKLSLVSNLKKGCLILFLLMYSVQSYAQIDSVTVNVHFETGIDPADSSLMVDVMHVEASIYDIDFMGEVVTTVYESVSNFPIALVKMTKQEFIDENLKSGDTITTMFYDIAPAGSYRIETVVRNFQGANFPTIITNHNLQ